MCRYPLKQLREALIPPHSRGKASSQSRGIKMLFFSDTFPAFPFKIVVYLKILKAKEKKAGPFQQRAAIFLAPISGHLAPPSGQW